MRLTRSTMKIRNNSDQNVTAIHLIIVEILQSDPKVLNQLTV